MLFAKLGIRAWAARIAGAAAFAGAIMFAQPAAANAAAPIVADDTAFPSPVTLADGNTFMTWDFTHYVCVAIVNHGARTATRVDLSLAYVGADHTVIGVDDLGITGKMLPGERFASSVPRGLATWDGNCTWNLTPRLSFGSQFTKSVTKRGPQLPVAAILVSAKHIVFDDGTTYTAAAIPQAGAVLSVDLPVQTARVAAGPPLVTPSRILNSPLEAVDAIRIVGVQGAIGSRNDYFRENVCVPSTNHDARVAKAAWFDLEVVDRNGIVVGTKRTVARGTFSKDIPATGMACMFIDGRRISGDDFSYIPTGDATPIVVGRIIAVPAELDFADGTSWTSPAPPVIGQPAIFP